MARVNAELAYPKISVACGGCGGNFRSRYDGVYCRHASGGATCNTLMVFCVNNFALRRTILTTGGIRCNGCARDMLNRNNDMVSYACPAGHNNYHMYSVICSHCIINTGVSGDYLVIHNLYR